MRKGGGRGIALERAASESFDNGRGRFYGGGVQRRVHRTVPDLRTKQKSIKRAGKSVDIFLKKGYNGNTFRYAGVA